VSKTADQRIKALCAKVESAQDLKDFEQASQELRAAIHEHLNELRSKVANFGLMIASTSDSKAAD
jgi:hypothetical protein